MTKLIKVTEYDYINPTEIASLELQEHSDDRYDEVYVNVIFKSGKERRILFANSGTDIETIADLDFKMLVEKINQHEAE